MRLCIDVGNSFIKAGVFSEETLHSTVTFPHKEIETLQDFLKNREVFSCIVSNVVGESIFFKIKNVLPSVPFFKFSFKEKLPLTIQYNTPKTLGNDRVAAAIGAISLFKKGPFLIIDSGTCITFDFVNNKNEYIGGNISPGADIRFQSFSSKTKNLPFLEKKSFQTLKNYGLQGRNTEEALLFGVFQGLKYEICGYVQEYFQTFPEINVISTKDIAHFFSKEEAKKIRYIEYLTLYGLNYYGKINGM